MIVAASQLAAITSTCNDSSCPDTTESGSAKISSGIRISSVAALIGSPFSRRCFAVPHP